MKFTVITPESLDMSRMIMSVVSVAMGGEQGSSGGEGGGSASLVSNTFYPDVIFVFLRGNQYSHFTSFLRGALPLSRSRMIMMVFQFPTNSEAMKSKFHVFSFFPF